MAAGLHLVTELACLDSQVLAMVAVPLLAESCLRKICSTACDRGLQSMPEMFCASLNQPLVAQAAG